MTDMWPNGVQIPIIGVSGEYASGKTLFGLSLALDDDGKLARKIRYYDAELSATNYVASLGVPDDDYIDIHQRMREQHDTG